MSRNFFEIALNLLNDLFDNDSVDTTIPESQHSKIVENINKNKFYPATQYVLMNVETHLIVNKVDYDKLKSELEEFKENKLSVDTFRKDLEEQLSDIPKEYSPPAIYNRGYTSNIVKFVEDKSAFINKYIKTERFINEIIVHTAATRTGWAGNTKALRMFQDVYDWHVDGNGWSDIGYHFMINRIGEIVIARPIDRTGAHTKEKNTNTIGIMLAGGYGGSANDKFEDHYTKKQKDTLFWLINKLMKHNSYINKLSGHNQYAAKACPCFRASEFFNANRNLVNKDFRVFH